jgi:predicted RNase H-like HicB family nuclease
MADYPVMFTVRDTVAGNGFLGAVTISGRAVIFLDEEDGKWWVYGVRPGAIAETGNTPEEAFLRFRNTYKNLLFDLAEESTDYDAFREAVEGFYYQKDQGEEDRWQSAFMAIRNGAVKPEEQFFVHLPQEAPETRPTGIAIERLDAHNARYNPTDNVPDYCAFALPTAA